MTHFQPHDEHFLKRALALAKHAEELGEVPVGAVITYDNRIIGEGWNCPISTQDPTAHAEIMALRAAAKTLNNYRLPHTTLYVTLEPCIMCAGAMIHARIGRLVFGAKDPKTGAASSVVNIFEAPANNHSVICEGGLLEEECRKLLQQFFQARRKN